ncbi:MAG: helix-turn-helix domain containing protein [Candidatus Binatia bacterium]|nr:helix-turn-helix domain containing protein [Candidatus Binatia bacterium]
MSAAETARMTTRDRQRLETRQRLYDTALAEFRERGFDAVQVEDIVRAAGVARGTFYLHFQNKEDLLNAFRGTVEEQIRDRLDGLPRPRSAKDLVRLVTDALLSTRGNATSARELVALAFRNQPEYDWNENPYFAPITRWVAHFQERGEIRKDLSAEEITGLFATTFFGTLLGPAAPRRGRRRAIECLGDVFLDGIRARS